MSGSVLITRGECQCKDHPLKERRPIWSTGQHGMGSESAGLRKPGGQSRHGSWALTSQWPESIRSRTGQWHSVLLAGGEQSGGS